MKTSPAPVGQPSTEEVGGRLASLFDAHGRMVLGLCRFLLRDADEADDATQQTFLSAYQSLLSGTRPRRPAQWLAEIARNECRARIAARMREPLPVAATVEGGGFEPVDAADQTELISELKTAIAELPDRQREAVVLRDFYGLSYREVATAMTVSVPVVESLLFRGRRHLSRTLGALPRLAQGALAIPVALREELASAIPGFEAAAAGLGITGGGAAAGGVVAKLAALPATAKVATASTVTAVAVGGVVTPQVINRHPQPAQPASTVTTNRSSSAPGAPGSTGTPASVGQKRGDDDEQRAGSGSSEPVHDEAREAETAEVENEETETETAAAEVEDETEAARPARRRQGSPGSVPAPSSEPPEAESEPGEIEDDSARGDAPGSD
jgi:RNA polymerase sigma factor (sigma-70 family)